MKFNGQMFPSQFPDPDVLYHKHEVYDNIQDIQMTHKTADPLFIEWTYVIDTSRYKFYVLKGHCGKGFEVIETFDIRGPEPDMFAFV